MPTKLALSLGASIFAFVLTGCGSSASPGASVDGGTTATTPDATTPGASIGSTPLPCDVDAVVQSHCRSCHQSQLQNGAPMALVTWEDFHAPVVPDSDGVEASVGEEVYQMVETRIHDAQNPMPPTDVKDPLGTADLATLDTWIANGAPKTDSVACAATEDGGATPLPDAAAPSLECTADNLVLAPASAWSMPDEDDVYVCYSVDIPDVDAGSPRHILGMTPHIDNHSIVHHVLLFEADADSDTSGITSTPTACSPTQSFQWRVLYGWAPGGGAMQTPPDVGFPYSSASKFIVQVHYNNIAGLKNQTDTTGFSFCTTGAPVKYDADVMAFGSMSFTIPPNGTLGWTCPLTLGQQYEGLNVFAAFPHMHQLGTSIATEQVHPGGGIVDLGQNTPWSFNNQIWFPISSTLHQGDQVTTRCTWQNNTGDPVGFGQDTEDEMCYSFTAYYPKLATQVSWAQPSLDNDSDHNCYASDAGLATPDGGWVVEDAGATVPADAGAGDAAVADDGSGN